MSEIFDEKVVAMKFDNKDFEKNAAQSMSTLQKLKAALNFKGAADSLEDVTKASKKVDFSNITNGIGEAIKNFNLMDMVGIKVLSRIADKVIDTGKNIAKSLTIDPVKTGMGIYEQKINSVQTMLNNSGKDLKSVNKVLDDLNDYSDKTIFSLNDMTTALGKFTAQGVDAEKAMTIIKGAANEAATMGAGSAEFSRFIYNLTQAYGMGKMTTIDWKSLENAGVAGKKFKEQLLESAKAMGTLDDAYRIVNGSHKGMQVTLANMREYLQDGIITADVMTDTFMKYADETTNFGQAAYAAAKEIKTFHQLLDVLGESVASTWSKSFGYIVGDFYEAKALWTNISILFEDTFGKINERRNELLKEWKEGFVDWSNVPSEVMRAIGSADEAFNSSEFFNENKISGRTMLLDAFSNVLLAIRQIVLPIKEAFREFFPETTAKNLWEMTKNLRDFTARLKLSQQSINDIKNIARGVFAVLKTGRDIIKDILGAIIPATKNTNSLLAVVLRLAGALGEFVAKMIPTIRESETWRIILAGIGNVLGFVIRAITLLVLIIARLIKAAHDFGLIQKTFQLVVGAVGLLINGIKNIIPATKQAFDYIRNYSGGVIGFIMDGVYKIGNFVSGLFSKNKTKNAAKNVDNIAKSVDGLSKSVEDVPIAEVASNSAAGLGELKNKIDEIKKDKYGNPIFSDDYKMTNTITPDEANEERPADKLEDTANSVQKSGTLIQRFGHALISIIKGIGGGIVKVVNIVRDALFGTEENVGLVTKGVIRAEGTLGTKTEGLANKMGKFFSGLIQGLKKVNWGAVIVGSLLAGLLILVWKVTNTFSNLGKGIKNATQAARNITGAFNNMTATIKAKRNVVANVLKSIALGILAIAASLWLLSTLQSDGKLESALGALVAALVIVIGLFSIAAILVKKAGIAGPLKQLSLAILAASAFMLSMSIAFGSIIETLKGLEGDYQIIAVAAGVFVGFAAIMAGLAFVLGKISLKDSAKGILTILVMTLSLKGVIKAIAGLTKDSKSLNGEEIKSVWLSGVLPVLAMLAGLTAAAVLIRGKGGVGSFVFLMGLVWAMGKLMDAITEMSTAGVFEKIEQHKFLVIALGGLLAVLTFIFAKWGSGFMQFAAGMIMIAGSILAIGFLVAALRNLKISAKDLIIPTVIVGLVLGIAAVMAVIFKKNKMLAIGMTSFAMVIMSIAAMIVSFGIAIKLIASEMNKSNSEQVLAAVILMAFGMAAVIGVLAVLVHQLGKTSGLSTAGLAGIILAISVLTLAIGSLAKSFNGVSIGSVIGSIAAIGVVLAGLTVLVHQMDHFKSVKAGPLISLVFVLMVVFTNIVILTMWNWYELIAPIAAMSAALGMLALLTNQMSNLKNVDAAKIFAMAVMVGVLAAGLSVLANMPIAGVVAGSAALSGSMVILALAMRLIPKDLKNISSMIVMAAMVAVVAGSLVVLTQLDMTKVLIASAALAGTMMLIGLAIRWASTDAKGIGTAIVMSAAIAVIAASLAVVTHFVGSNITTLMAASAAIAGVLLVMAGACIIVSKVNGEVSKVLATASSFVIIAIAIGIVALALNHIKEVPIDKIIGIVGIIATVAASIMLVTAVGKSMGKILAAAGAIAIVTASLLIVAYACQQLDEIKNIGRLVGGIAALLAVMSVFVIISGYLGTKTLIGAVAMAAVSAALIVLAYACNQMDKIANIGRIVGGIAALLAVMMAFAIIAGIPAIAMFIGLGSLAFAAMGAGLLIIAFAVNQLDKCKNIGRIVGGIAALAGVLILMAISGLVQLAGAPGVTAMGAALVALSAGLLLLDGVTIGGGYLAGLAGGLALMGLAGVVMLIGSAGLTAAGPGFLALAEGLAAMGDTEHLVTGGYLAGIAGGLSLIGLAGIPLLIGSAGFSTAGPGFLVLAEGLVAMGKIDPSLTGARLAGLAGGLALMGLAGIPLLIGAAGLSLAAGSLSEIAYGLAALNGTDIDGPRLISIAAGLAVLGLAGIPLLLGAPGLMLTSGPVAEIARGLAELGRTKIDGKTIKDIANGLMSMAVAGIIGILGGPGLMLLAYGIEMLSEALALFASVLETLAEVAANQVTKDAALSGENIIKGLANGISDGLPAILALMAVLALGVLGSFNEVLGIHSPAVMFELNGKYIVLGLANGIQTFEDKALAETALLAEREADTFIDTITNRLKDMTSAMGDTFSGFTNQLFGGKKLVKKQKYEYGAMRDYWVEEESEGILDKVKSYLFGDGSTSIADILGLDGFSVEDLFSGAFDGLNELSGVFKDLVGIGGDMNLEVSGLDTNFDALAGAIDKTDGKTKGLNKSMKDSINNAKDLNTALQRTNRDIEQSIVGKKASYDEFQNMMTTIYNTNYSNEVLQDIVDQYESNGLTDELYQTVKNLYARALYGGEEAIEEYNRMVKNEGNAEAGAKIVVEGMAKGLEEGTRELKYQKDKFKATWDALNNDLYNEAYAGEGPSKYNPATEIWGIETAYSDAAVAARASAKEMDKNNERYAQWLAQQEEIESSNNKDAADRIIMSFTEAVQNAIAKYFLPEKFEQIGTNLCFGLVRGIKGEEDWTKEQAASFAQAVVDTMQKIFKEHSPSRVTMQMGEYLDEGLAMGLNNSDEAVNAADRFGSTVLDELRYQLARILAMSDEEWTPVITPVFDFTNANADMQRFNNGLSSTMTMATNSDFSYYRASQLATEMTLAGMSKAEFQQYLAAFADNVVNAINAEGPVPVEVNVNLEGDAEGIFKLVQDQNNQFKRTAGYSGLI